MPDCTLKAVDWDQLDAIRQQCRGAGKTVVWTNGCFDLMHSGHVLSLQAAKKLGDVLIVGLNADEAIRELKGPGRPVLRMEERLVVLSALECVDYVIVFHELQPDVALQRLKPDIHCKGSEYAPPSGKPVPEMATVVAYGGRVEFLPYVEGISTTEIIRRIRQPA